MAKSASPGQKATNSSGWIGVVGVAVKVGVVGVGCGDQCAGVVVGEGGGAHFDVFEGFAGHGGVALLDWRGQGLGGLFSKVTYIVPTVVAQGGDEVGELCAAAG